MEYLLISFHQSPWRCGYTERAGKKGQKQTHVILSGGNEATLWAAGLTSPWNDLFTCTKMTRAPNADIESIHHRMPAILNIQEREAWLSGSDDVLDLWTEVRHRHHPVSRFGARDKGPEMIEQASVLFEVGRTYM
ncbi:SOS response-associated peptidase [Aliiroseovarius sp. M344]|uniref:SOS response-associated peptidase n=1 Tax=Aliiroseovarius sp. M344 TaxID=2867010 RepID=UPI0021ADAF79|nr:SOS response-associated peptidase [Aliiroseovarius sp. M344]UWQ15660.1 SOS response-associated peptidase [Aliiroseovarius sp. M344]